MKGFDINFISKQQLLGLEMEDVYIEDYYFCAALSKKGFSFFFKKFSFWFTSISSKFSFDFYSNSNNGG
jgi:hypothetical protein